MTLQFRYFKILEYAFWLSLSDHKERDIIFGGLAEMASKTCVKFLIYKHPEEGKENDPIKYDQLQRGNKCMKLKIETQSSQNRYDILIIKLYLYV